MPSYLDNTFLADLSEEFGDDLSADNATMALVPAAGERQIAPPEYIQLPGGIVMEKKTFFLLVAVVAGVAIYLYSKKSKKSTTEDA